jgi:transcriptional regulator with XRE-family HTH domain
MLSSSGVPIEAEAFYVRLGRRVQDLRKQRRLTQEQLGARLVPQVTRASIANIESGKQRVLAHSLAQIAETLEVSITDLLREEPAPVEPEVRQTLEAQLHDRLKIAPDDMLRLTRKLGLLDPGGNDE